MSSENNQNINPLVPFSVSVTLFNSLSDRTATVGVIGLGYVGLPLAAACARAGFNVVGLDIDETKTAKLNSGTSYIDAGEF